MRRRLPIATAVLAVALAAAWGQTGGETPEETLERAARLQKDGVLREAMARYEDFLKRFPDHVRALDARYGLAQCFDHVGEPDKAIEGLSRLLEESKDKRFRHRADAYMHLVKLLGADNKYEDAIKRLEEMLGEGAGLYEAEAYDLCGTYHALLGNHDRAAAMFNILKRKPDERRAMEAAYKLAVVWLKAGSIEPAKAAVDEFAALYPGNPRVPDLYLKVAKYYYEKRDIPVTLAICEQVKNRFANTLEAMEAAYLIALCHKADGKFAEAAEAMMAIARLQKTDRTVALEAIFEAAQILHKQLNDMERAVDYYRLAADASRTATSERGKQIFEYATFQIAEHYFRNEKWAAALDMYLMLQRLGTEANVMGRVLSCQSKLSPDGSVSLSGQTEAELEFIRRRIADNPGTLLAAHLEVFLLDMKLKEMLGAKTGAAPWARLEPIAREYEGLFKKYQPATLESGDLVSLIYFQMGRCHAGVEGDPGTPGVHQQIWKRGLELFEKALAVNPQTLSRTAILESIAVTAKALGDNRKAFDTYKRLYELTGETPPAAGDTPPAGAGGEPETEVDKASEYLRGMVAIADRPTMLAEAMTYVNNIIEKADPGTREARHGRFYRAELYFLMKRYSDSAREYKEFVRLYGPRQDAAGEVLPHLKEPRQVDEKLRQVYEAGVRAARSWFFQHHTQNMLREYAWITRNQAHDNVYLPEAWYFVAASIGKAVDKEGPEKRALLEQRAETFWKELVNSSMDFGSKGYAESFRPWIRDGVVSPWARRYAESAILKAGEIYGDLGKHDIAAAVFRQHLELKAPAPGSTDGRAIEPLAGHEIARYALGRELIQLGDMEGMADVYRPYIDGLRSDRFRASALHLLGHYGTQAGLLNDAREAYAALLDEYGPPNPADREGKPIPVPVAQRLRRESGWSGVRTPPPEKWDVGEIRYSLGFTYSRSEDWPSCARVLTPFLEDEALKGHELRAKALFLLGRALGRARDYAGSVAVLQKLVAEYPGFEGAEAAYVDLIMAVYRVGDWRSLDQAQAEFSRAYPASERRAYMDLYVALGDLGRGRVEQGVARLRSIAGANTYEDIKADAHYHLGRRLVETRPPDYRAALAEFDRSVQLFARERALYEAGRCAAELKDWDKAHNYLDRAVREFPAGDPDVLTDAKRLITEIIKERAR